MRFKTQLENPAPGRKQYHRATVSMQPRSVVNQWGVLFPLKQPINVHEAERSLDLIYDNFSENMKLPINIKTVMFISRNGKERNAGLFHGTD